jgi:EAL domain-containing protein (putative c-di-GMP-specific phosphodiesterase class I)/GAF domain-containing protein
MARSDIDVTREAFARSTRMRSPDRRIEDYRRAFVLLCEEPFDELDKTLARMLEVLAITLDVNRVGFWTFEEPQQFIRCEHLYRVDQNSPMGPTLLRRADCPNYFDSLCKQLVIAVEDAQTDPRTAELRRTYLQPLDVRSMLDVPVRAFGRYLGVLCHEQTGSSREWSREDETFAAAVATQIALAFERDHARLAQTRLLERSLRDEESQLANRLQLEQALAAYLQNPAATGGLVVTCADQFNFIAGSIGVRRMPQLLRQLGARLIAAAPEGTLVARIATNEFALLLRDVPAAAVPAAVQGINTAAKLPLVNEGQRLFMTLSTGYSLIERGLIDRSPIDLGTRQTPELLIAEAQLAANQARDAGGDRVEPFTEAMRQGMRSRISLEQDLRRGLDAAEFDLHFQPIVPLTPEGCASVEALLRWRHPTRGLIAPPDFIHVAIDSGVMLELGRRVLRAACGAITHLRARPGLEDLQVTVNMSAPEILLPGTAEAVRSELLAHGLAPRALTIEITETSLMVDMERAAVAIAEIRALGVGISLDDFGTAYSSLCWLRKLPIDKIKIDRSFVAGITKEPEDLAIVKSIIDLAKAFRREVVAEGVETREQLRLLRQFGVDHAQGFLIAGPLPLDEIDPRSLRPLADEPG